MSPSYWYPGQILLLETVSTVSAYLKQVSKKKENKNKKCKHKNAIKCLCSSYTHTKLLTPARTGAKFWPPLFRRLNGFLTLALLPQVRWIKSLISSYFIQIKDQIRLHVDVYLFRDLSSIVALCILWLAWWLLFNGLDVNVYITGGIINKKYWAHASKFPHPPYKCLTRYLSISIFFLHFNAIYLFFLP